MRAGRAHVPPFLCSVAPRGIPCDRSPLRRCRGRCSRRPPSAQPSAPVVTRTDVIYGRVEGSALLANLAYPDGPALKPAILSVHGGRWRAGNRADASSIKVARVGRLRLLRHVDRLPPGRRLAGAGAVSRPAVRDPLGARPRRRVPHRSRAHLPHRPVGRRPAGVAGGHHRRGRLPARRRLGEGAQRRPRASSASPPPTS